MSEGLGKKINVIKAMPRNIARQELGQNQHDLDLGIELQAEIDGIGMGVLRDGTPFLTGRGLARLVDIENLHIRTISHEWNEDPLKPRVARIKEILDKSGINYKNAHIEIVDGSRTIHAYPAPICLAVLEYYAFDAAKPRDKARDNFRILAGKALQELIYSKVGYDPTGQQRFRKWHERIELNHQSAPAGFFSIFNEAHPIIYELIMAGAEIGEKMVVDISIGKGWASHWDANGLAKRYGDREKFPHRYPDDHPQAKSNPQIANCYPLESLGEYRRWLQEDYLGQGKFAKYLRGRIPPSVAELAIERLAPQAIEKKN